MISTAGFLEPDPSLFQLSDPVFAVNGIDVSDPDVVDGWDYSTDLRVAWEVDIDKAQMLDQCGLGPSTDVRLGFRWRAAKTTLYESGLGAPVSAGRNKIEARIPSDRTGGVVTISLFVLVMTVYPHECSPLAAHRPGSILWSESRQVYLEGVGSRFPLVAVEFPPGEMQKGMWEFAPSSTDLEASAMGTFSLRLNTGHPAVGKLLDSPNTAESKLMQKLLKADLYRHLISWALREGSQIRSYDEDTIGGVLWSTFRRYFSDSDFEEMRSGMESTPWRVEARIQAATAEAVK
ncbi:hypothetical protein O4090_01175 [Dietzia kunjamensis]|jgi:hypothetical protein|uniref:hypothetical protein n=1 Tax=Dietzia kunjamensis TaxID=322509 RepID=UPI0022B46D8D|nr:hypothetical protein [Dietzia kunjamensis]MCZ4654581.1 hypothetical protein [Dietzia kunjamensis]